jgi:two-component system sensor histidine kinase PhoQ
VNDISLKKRFINHSAISLVVLMTISAIVVYINFTSQLKKDMQERLKLHIYNILSVAEFHEASVDLPAILHNPDFNTVGSGLWAQVLDSEGRIVWKSLSLIEDIPLSDLPNRAGQWVAGEVRENNLRYLTMSYKVRVDGAKAGLGFYFVVGELKNKSNAELRTLSFWLVVGFGGMTSLLLLGQYIVLIKAFKPINEMANEIVDLEEGKREDLSDSYPKELQGVERNINALLSKERRQREKYREGMANLAHSLKTPMAIITNELQSYPDNVTMNDAIKRVNDNVEYQLRRAVISGHAVVASGVKVVEIVHAVLETMTKIYDGKNVFVEQNIDDAALFFGDENDLLEVFGNLIDNAYKYAHSKIVINIYVKHRGLIVRVEDDGPGLNEDEKIKVLRRGERLDMREPGQGIGLSIVDDIVESYGGQITILKSDLGGACFEIAFNNQ